MKYKICINGSLGEEYEMLLSKLPKKISEDMRIELKKFSFQRVNEIRIHAGSNINLITEAGNVKTDITTDYDEVDEIVKGLCGLSLYSHFDTIKDGYISVGKGIRAGICGRAACNKENIEGIYEINSVNIRIPHNCENASAKVYELLKSEDFGISVLIYSSPGVGKTTVLKDLICKLSSLNKRISVIDTRDELSACMPYAENADFFISYPKGTAIMQSTKSMTPEIIICDELSSVNEANDVLYASHCGVKFVATAHAACFEDIKRKELLSRLISSGVFDYAVGLKRKNGERIYEYEINDLRAI